MAVQHRLVGGSPEEVWAALADGSRYGEWVVGPSHSQQSDDRWPHVGSSIEFDPAPAPQHARQAGRRRGERRQ